jgi:peptide/nickel transport system substrate-binding protein
MHTIRRRRLLRLSAIAAALPRFAIAAGNDRPIVTVAVQAIVTSNTLDPLAEQSNVGERILNSYVESLIGRNLQGELQSVPALATDWKRISDNVVEVTLRRGVKFHNGDELTAEDVAFTFGPERMFGTTQPAGMGKTLAMNTARPVDSGKQLPPQVPPVARRLWPSLERVQIIDRYTVRFINATPDVTLEGRMTAMGSQIINRRAFDAAPTWLAYARQPIGTGPYKVRSFSPENELILDAHDDYWGGRPPIQTLRFVEVPEVSQRLNGLRAGQYQFACDLSPDQIRTVDAEPRLQVAGGVIQNIRFSIFDKYDIALKDPRVRQAMTHAIDRQAIVHDLWDGRTIIPAGLQFPFYGPMFVDDWTVPKYDPALARSLVKQAGYKGDPIPYRLLNDYYTDQTSTAQIITEMWQQVGLNVVIEMKENWAQIFAREGTRGLNDWSNSALFNDPVSSLVTQHGPQGQQQQVGMWANAEFNELCGALVSGIDMAKRHQVFARMLEICEREDPAYNVLHQNATFTGKLKSILWKPAPDFAMDFRATNWGGSVRG